MVVASDTPLIGRENEFGQLRDFVREIADAPRAVVVRGEAGIGKTTLWSATVEEARGAGLTVLSARCVETELPLGLVGLSDLLQDAFPAAADELAEHERSALATAIGLEAPQETSREAIALPRAFLALLRVLARDAPVLLAVDNVQWLDAPSARVVSFAARRLGDAPVAILVTLRDGTSDASNLSTPFGERLEEVRLGPLSVGALAHLLRTRLGVRIPRPVLGRVHEASGGNPMFALEFARSVADRRGQQLGPVPIPASLQELVRARFELLPVDVQRLLAIAAACEQPTRSLLTTVDRAAAELVEAAVDAGAIAIGDDGAVRFTHPLLASAAYADLWPSQRRDVHAQLSLAMDDIEARARHRALATSEPDEAVASLLDDAAMRARARGAPESAAELEQEAVRLTPSGAADRYERMLTVVEYLAAGGRMADACEWADRLLATELKGPMRARALMLRCWLENDLVTAGRILSEAFEQVGDDRTLHAYLLFLLSSYRLYLDDLDLTASEKAALEALSIAEQAGDTKLLAAALGIVADRADLAGHPDDAAFERAMELEEAEHPHGWTTARERFARVLLRRGDLDGARRMLEAAIDQALRAGAVGVRGRASAGLFDVAWRAGDWALAERCLDEAWDVGVDDTGDLWAEAELPERRARLCALRGQVDDGRRLVSEAIDGAERIHWAYLASKSRWVLGFLELSLGEPARAWQALAEIDRTPARGSLEVLEAVADGVDALVALDRLDDADGLLATLRDEAAARGHCWAAPAAERCAALVLIARGDPDAAAVAAERAADGFQAIGFPLDRGRALFVAGEALRRSGKRRRAAEKLEAARDIFAELGAALWVERAETELRRANPRPRRDRELTSAEQRVAALVASGKTNREVASQLFTTVATVEAHLTRIYRKLGLRSRTELARRVADGTLSLADE